MPSTAVAEQVVVEPRGENITALCFIAMASGCELLVSATDHRAAMDRARSDSHLDLQHGALATSGDSRRFLLKNGIRYGHILDPRTGWSVREAPRSVTVAASSCPEAGQLATLALLHGHRASEFLDQQLVRYWIVE